MPNRKQKDNNSTIQNYDDLKDEKAERRDAKKMKKMPVHSSGLYEIWKIKTEKDIKKEKNDHHKA